MSGHGLDVFSAGSWLSHLGALGLFIVVFAETGLLVGLVLPGDSMLFCAGALCASAGTAAHADLAQVLVAAAAGAVLGAQVGYYWIGRRAGRALLSSRAGALNHRWFAQSGQLLERFGHGRGIFISRFIPVARTMMNPLAGVLRVPYRTFVTWQIFGGLVWVLAVTTAGYGLGAQLPGLGSWLRILAVLAALVLGVHAALVTRARRVPST